MRLPYIQVANELIDHAAPEIALRLKKWSEGDAFYGCALFIRWALGRCPDQEPPSANAIIRGADASQLIARAARYPGDPEALVAAFCEVSHPILERTTDGYRVRGLDRYDAAWGKSHPELWKAWKAKHQNRPGPEPEPARNRSESGTKPEQTRPGTMAEPAPQTQTQTQTQIELQTQTEPKHTSAGAAALVFEHWRTRMKKNARTLFSKERRDAVEARLEDGYTVADLCLAVDGCMRSPFHMGENPARIRYDDLELICRTASGVDRFKAMAEDPAEKLQRDFPDESEAELKTFGQVREELNA